MICVSNTSKIDLPVVAIIPQGIDVSILTISRSCCKRIDKLKSQEENSRRLMNKPITKS
jgi:hypothetical protein